MNNQEEKVRVSIRLNKETKQRMDSLISWGCRDILIEEIIKRILDLIEKEEIKYL